MGRPNERYTEAIIRLNKIFSIEGELSSLTPEDRKKQRIIREQSELEAFWLWAKKNAVSSSKKFVALVLLVKGVIVESIESDIPEDLVQIFKVLGDKTRLRIIKLLMQNVCNTQELAQKLEISEVAVSKILVLSGIYLVLGMIWYQSMERKLVESIFG